MSGSRRDEDELLAALNRDLPAGVDWKEGARRYLAAHIRREGEWSERYHLVKPFCGGPDFRSFFDEGYRFLNLVQELDLAPRSRILDVGCGPGWVAHWLAKLGHRVVGLDISPELVELARRRVAADPFPPYVGEGLAAEFRVHDVERDPVATDEPFAVAVLESTLHHFLDPVAALRNVLPAVEEDGTVAILEPLAPPPDSPEAADNLHLMRRYHTLERPYSRDQLLEILDHAGLAGLRFVQPVNGFFPEATFADDLEPRLVAGCAQFNYVLATRHPREAPEPLRFGPAFYEPEVMADGATARWSHPESWLEASGPRRLLLHVASHFPGRFGREQRIWVTAGDLPAERLTLTPERPAGELALELPPGWTRLTFFSDAAFRPALLGEHDSRTLAFMLTVVDDAGVRPG